VHPRHKLIDLSLFLLGIDLNFLLVINVRKLNSDNVSGRILLMLIKFGLGFCILLFLVYGARGGVEQLEVRQATNHIRACAPQYLIAAEFLLGFFAQQPHTLAN